MVQLIENKQCAPTYAGPPKQFRGETDLLIRHHRTVIVTRFASLLVRQDRIQLDAYLPSRSGPLPAQMIRRTDYQQAACRSIRQILVGNAQREPSFSCRRCRRGQKVGMLMAENGGYGSRLPVT
jgi:hypothetical protein